MQKVEVSVSRVEDEDDSTPVEESRAPRVWLGAVAVSVLAFTSWCWATAMGTVRLDTSGDESSRLLTSYSVASPGGVFHFLTTGHNWVAVHPPVDVAFRGAVNAIVGALVHNPATAVRVNQVMATLLVAVGVAAIAVGLRVFSGMAVAVFLGFSIPSAALIYTAHHALGENLAIALVGLGAGFLFRGRFAVGGALVGIAGLVRPEAALVFATLGAVPFATRHYRRAAVFAALAAGPAVAQAMAAAQYGHSYSSVSLWARRPLFNVAFRGIGPKMYWGQGIRPWAAAATVVVLFGLGVSARVPLLSCGRLLCLGWVAWTMIFAYMAARGAIPVHVRTYVLLHLFGALAIGIAAHEVLAVVRPAITWVVAGAAALAVLAAMIASSTTRREWNVKYPADIAAVSRYLGTNGRNGDGILSDWMQWREFIVDVYGTVPGSNFCNYLVCTTGAGDGPPAFLIDSPADIADFCNYLLCGWRAGIGPPAHPFDEVTDVAVVPALTRAWRFVAAGPPRFITMFDDRAFSKWQEQQLIAYPNLPLHPSFVRPLLTKSGDCFNTVPGLPAARYCLALHVGRFDVLELVP